MSGCRLPKEEEWERAARGLEVRPRKYPWGGDPPDETRANYDNLILHNPSPVGLFPDGNTSEEICDMAGNVWEWTSSDYEKVGEVATGNSNRNAIRGGSFDDDPRYLRGVGRGRFVPGVRSLRIGFRVCLSIHPIRPCFRS